VPKFAIVMADKFLSFQHMKNLHVQHLQDIFIYVISLPQILDIQIQMTHPCIQNQFQISLHDLTMASVALSAPRMGRACSVSRESHSVLTDTTNKAQNAKMELAIHMHLKEKASVAHGKWQVQWKLSEGSLRWIRHQPQQGLL
jgi:hypothetical protein